MQLQNHLRIKKERLTSKEFPATKETDHVISRGSPFKKLHVQVMTVTE